MTQNIQNFDNRNNGYGMFPGTMVPQVRPQPQAVRIPDYYAPNEKKSFKEILEENPMYSMGIKGFFGPLIEHPFASILTWFGCGFLLDKYTAACGGEYDKSLLKKVTNFGDRIEQSAFIQSKPMQSLLGLFKKGGQKGGNVIQKNSVLRAIWKTPTMPEWEIVKSEMLPQRQRILHDFSLITKELHLEDDKGFAKLNKLALNNDERMRLKDLAATLNTEEKASSYIQLRRLGLNEEEVKKIISSADGGVARTKQEILKIFGNKNVDWLKSVHKDTVGNTTIINEVQEACKKAGGKVRVGMGEFKPFGLNIGILTAPTKRTISCDSIFNRLFSLTKEGAETATGRFMSRFMQMVHRGLTFGGGKLGVLLFIAPAFVETAINVHKAEPSQKVGTGVSNLVNHISWVFTFPFALQIMHHICGAKYAGMDESTIQKIRDKVNELNKDNKEGIIKDYETWKNRRNDVNNFIKEHSKVDGQKWYTRAIRKVAGWITPDLGKVDAYNTGNFITTKFHQLRNLPRNMFGVPLRFILFMGLTMGVLDTILNKGIKLIFGDSYDSMKEEEIKDAKKEEKKFLKDDLTDRLYEAQRRKIAGGVNTTGVNINRQQAQNNSVAHHGAQLNNGGNAVSEELVGDNYSYIPTQNNAIKSKIDKSKRDNYKYIPSQDSTIITTNETNPNTRSYIPSQLGANITKTWDNSGVQEAFGRADRAEQKALKVLGGNFEGM